MDMRAILSVLAILAVVGLLAGLSAPVAAQEPETLLLYDTGDAGTAAYRFYVSSPGSVALDSDYLNFTVKSAPVVSGVGTEANWYVLVYVDEGTTNYSWNKTLAVVNDATVYSNISLADPGDYLVANSSGVLTIRLLDATFVEQDLVVSSFAVYTSQMNQAVELLLPAVITIAVFGVVLTMLNKTFKKRL
jgi:hypothetical protein